MSARLTAQHTTHAGHLANSPPTPSTRNDGLSKAQRAHNKHESDARRTCTQFKNGWDVTLKLISFFFNSTSLHDTSGHHCGSHVCAKGCEECASDRAARNICRASGELPADTNYTERWPPQSSTCTRHTRNRKPGELPTGIPTPRSDGPPQSSTRTRHSALPSTSGLPANTQAQRNNETPRAVHAAHDELTTSQRRLKSCRLLLLYDVSTPDQSCRLQRQQRGPRVSTQGSAPPLTSRRTPRQPGSTPTLLPPSTQKIMHLRTSTHVSSQCRHGPSATGPRLPATVRSCRTWCTPT